MENHGFQPINEDDQLRDRKTSEQNDGRYERPRLVYVERSRMHPLKWILWTIVCVFAVILIFGAVLWASGVSHSLHNVATGVHQNGQMLAKEQAQLSGIQGQLQVVSQKVSDLMQWIRQLIFSITHRVG